MYNLYIILSIFFLPIYLLIALYRLVKGKDDYNSFLNRFGIPTIKRPKGKIIWFHVASVGEMLSVKRLVNELANEHQILLTSYTLNSKRIFTNHFGGRIIHQTICFDSFLFVRLFLKFWHPSKFILVESEIWPSMIYEAGRKMEMIFLNSKIAERDCRRWRFFGRFLGDILSKFKLNLPQSKIDLERLSQFYKGNIKFIGNLKYAVQMNNLNEELIAKLTQQTKGRKIITIASSHKGEEELVLGGMMKILERKDIFIFLAPRHTDRKAEVKALLEAKGVKFITRTSGLDIAEDTRLMLIDTLGELNNFYVISDIAIVCGSFNYTVGGHNIIEPAKLNNAVIVGPNMVNFEEIIDEFKRHQAVVQLSDASGLDQILETLLSDQALAKSLQKNAFDITEFYYNIYPEIKKLLDAELATN